MYGVATFVRPIRAREEKISEKKKLRWQERRGARRRSSNLSLFILFNFYFYFFFLGVCETRPKGRGMIMEFPL